MVNQNHGKDVACSFFLNKLQKLTENIAKTNLPEFIINFNSYQKWPKKLFRRYTIQDKYEKSLVGPQLSSEIGKKIENALVSIYERLSQLGDYGNLFKRKFSNQVQYFCPSLKKSNYIIEYSPTAIDKELIKIVQFHQNQPGGKYKFTTQFENNIYLAQLEEKIKIFYELRRRRQKSHEEVHRLDSQVNYMLSPLFRLNYVDRNCLRCTTHFISGTTTNACHPGVSFYPFDAYELPSYESFSSIENNVKASMCSMLNELSGGIILLGCQRQGPTTILPKGLFITQKQKDSLQQKLEGYLTKITPKVKRNEEIFIDFVPVVQIKQNPNRNSEELYIHESVSGYYVCRIFMLPKQNYKVYLLKASTEHSSLQIKKENESITIPDSDHYSYIIEKFEKYYESPESYDTVNNSREGVLNCHYNIKCCLPWVGKQAYDKKQDQQPQSFHEQQPSVELPAPKKADNKPVKIVDLANKKHEDYKLWTLVVGDKNTMMKLIECANSEKQNKGIKIEQMYADCKFKLTKTTWVMFHDEKFELMKKLAEKYSITYKSKELKMIASNVYLEIENCLYGEHYNELYTRLYNQCQSTIKDLAVKDLDGKQVWIIWFDSLRGSIYAYFFLSDLSYKVRFIRGASHFKKSLANTQNAAQAVQYQNYPVMQQGNSYYQPYQTNEYQGYMQQQGYQNGYGYYPPYN